MLDKQVLVDTMIWADHITRPNQDLLALLAERRVVSHPFVIGELALGNLRDRAPVLGALARLPSVNVAFDAEVLAFIERYSLHGSGVGYVDVHLLVAARLTDDVTLWTRDRRLHLVASKLRVAADIEKRS